MAILPLTVALILAASSFLRSEALRESIAQSYIVVSLMIAVSTEGLSLLNAVTDEAIRLTWIVLTAMALVLMGITLRRSGVRAPIQHWRPTLSGYGAYERLSLVLVTSVLCVTLILALAYPPNNWDSMTYHMARVAQWIQHGSIDMYPTANDRQTHNPPLAEWAILHIQLLSRSDTYANLIQWFSFCISIVVVTLIAKEFGLTLRGQLFSAVVAATIPTAILESSRTQNDLVLTSFCVAFAWFLLKFVRTLSTQDAVLCSISLGLALLTKGTAYLYCCAIGLTLGGASVLSRRLHQRLTLLWKLTVIVIGALALNAGHFFRAYQVYGLDPTSQTTLLNERVSIPTIASNVVRNVALHVGTPFDQINYYSLRVLQIILGDQLNDPASTLQTTIVKAPFFSLHEDYAGNLLHLILVVLAFLILPFVAVPSANVVYRYAGAIVAGVLLHCAALKWQPWATRYHTTLFMLAAPFIAAVSAGIRSYQTRFFAGVTVLLFVASLPFVLTNQTRSFLWLTHRSLKETNERFKSYFVNRPELYADYRSAASIILREGVEEVGLCFGYDDYEYPLFVLAGTHASRGAPRFRHVGVLDASRIKEDASLSPPGLILVTKRLDEDQVHGKGRLAAEACLTPEDRMLFDSPTLRLWKRMSGHIP